ncbi:efflux transporter outer membrane subunit [Tahibacter soli]|uniref:TolC family protein n=1 Tax=Tahibacter soli TaxID=2983605 RepID=A0A9X3YKK3_9GAMM|nr:TolC family protein [Tahibacter soli]MDC8013987.1 TolC family protein [Tahibacter soli]
MFTKKRFTRTTAAALLAATLAGCAVGPDYVRPDTPDVALRNADPAHYDTAPAPAQWWRQFDDPVLAGLVDRALTAAFDVRLAVARVDAARAAFTEARLDQLPHVTVGADYAHSRQQQPGSGSGERVELESRSAGFDARWELDLFGRVRRQTEAARAELGAREANLRDAQVTVAAEVARNYFQLRGAQRQLGVARDNRDNQRETLRLTQFRFDEGGGTELDVASSRARLAATEATIPSFEAAEKRYAYRLAVLLGQKPGALDAELAPKTAPAYVKALPIGDVANLLRRRPDVRAAERNLAAATARVGVATADLYPRISVAGFIGFLAGTGTGLGDAASKAWSVNPSVSWTGLDFGSARARLRTSKADADGALAAYEQSLLVALEDTENAFVNYGKQTARLASLVDQAQASRRAAQLAEIQFREGGADFLLLLDAQRTLLSAEDAVAQAETDVNTGAVAVYKALGGIDDDAAPIAAR